MRAGLGYVFAAVLFCGHIFQSLYAKLNLNEQGINAIKVHLLKTLGLNHRPYMISKRLQLPDFVWGEYHRLIDPHSPFYDTVRTIFPNAAMDKEEITFDCLTDDWIKEEELVKAELRVQLNATQIVEGLGLRPGSTQFRLNLYRTTKPEFGIRNLIETKSFQSISGSESQQQLRWTQFDVTDQVMRSTALYHHYGITERLLVSLEAAVQSGDFRRRFPLVRGYLSGSAISLYSVDNRRSKNKSRLRRSTDSIRLKKKKKNRRRQHRHRLAIRAGICQRYPLHIRFEDLNWHDWILAPYGYNAYFCSGQCPYPLGDHQNTSNHAIIQSLINSVNPAAVPRPNCVPTATSSISMLYVDLDDRVVIKKYPEMVVESCGCR